MSVPAVEAEGLFKRFGVARAVDGVSFTVRPGEVFGLVGPNGAGKSTLLHMLLGLIAPDGGRIRIFGQQFPRDRQRILARMNVASPYAALPARLTVWENLSVYARLYGVAQQRHRIDFLLELMDVARLRNTVVSKLSSGETTRVSLCKALLNDPDLLLLDEPTAYLDPDIAARVRRMVAARGRAGSTVLYTSHNMAEIEAICDRVLFLGHGKVVAIGTPVEVTRAILREQRPQAALGEAFLRVAGGRG